MKLLPLTVNIVRPNYEHLTCSKVAETSQAWPSLIASQGSLTEDWSFVMHNYVGADTLYTAMNRWLHTCHQTSLVPVSYARARVRYYQNQLHPSVHWQAANTSHCLQLPDVSMDNIFKTTDWLSGLTENCPVLDIKLGIPRCTLNIARSAASLTMGYLRRASADRLRRSASNDAKSAISPCLLLGSDASPGTMISWLRSCSSLEF